MKEALELNILGIKCDTCDYKNDDIKVEKYDEWLGKPCPKCGSNLLTQEDLDNTKLLIETAKFLNKILPKPQEYEEMKSISIEMNGTGDMSFKIN